MLTRSAASADYLLNKLRPLTLEGVNIRLSSEGVTIRMIDHDTQQPSTDSWLWSDLT
jgi:hypothetical protein